MAGKIKAKKPTSLKELRKKTEKKSWERVSIIFPAGLMHKIRALAYWERKSIKDVATEAIEHHLLRYKENLKPIPHKQDSNFTPIRSHEE